MRKIRQRISTEHQVLQEKNGRRYFGSREAEFKREGIHISVRDGGQETRENDNQTNIDAEINANKIHTKLSHPGEDRMCATAKNLDYNVKGTLELCEDCATAKIKHKSLHKVAEEPYLKTGKMIYQYLIYQKKPSYGGSKNWFLIQYSDEKKRSFFPKAKEYFTEKFTPYKRK